MKKIIPVLFICILVMIFSSCGNKETNIEECNWKLQSVTSLDSNKKVLVDDVHLILKNGEIVINDVTNVETYKGAYEEMLVTDEKDDYKIFLEGKEGYMSLVETDKGDKTLLLTVDGYDLCFFAK